MSYQECHACHGLFMPAGLLCVSGASNNNFICFRCNDEINNREKLEYAHELQIRLDHIRSLKEITCKGKFKFYYYIFKNRPMEYIIRLEMERTEECYFNVGETRIIETFKVSEDAIFKKTPDFFIEKLKQAVKKFNEDIK